MEDEEVVALSSPAPSDHRKRNLNDLEPVESSPAPAPDGEEVESGVTAKEVPDASEAKRPRLDDSEAENLEAGGRNENEKGDAVNQDSPQRVEALEKEQPLAEEASIIENDESSALEDAEKANSQPHDVQLPSSTAEQLDNVVKPTEDDPQPVTEQSLSEPGNQTTSRKMEVPNNKVGVLIGKAGKTICYMQHKSGAKIQITRDSDADPEAATRPVELIGTLASVNKAEMMINEVIAENVKPSTFLRNYGQEQGYWPRGPLGAVPQWGLRAPHDVPLIPQWGHRAPHDVPLMPSDHLQHCGGPYPSQNQQYPPYGSRPSQGPPRGGFGSGWEQWPPMQIPPNNTGGYDYYGRQGEGHAANFQPPGPSTFLRNYGQQQGCWPRGPPGAVPQWGHRAPHDVPLMPSDHLQHLGGPYPSQNQQYPPYGSHPSQGPPRGGFGSGWEQRPPMQIPPNNTGGYDYYDRQGEGHAANFQPPGPHPTRPSGPPMGHSMPSHPQANHNYAQPPYSQTQAVTQQPTGSSQQGLSEPGNLTTSRKMEVPNNKIGVLIGKGGETIRNVQHESGAKIQITRDIDASDREAATRPVELIGTHASVNKAEMMIKEVIAEDDAGLALDAEALEKMLKQVSNVKVPRYLLVSSGCGIFVLDLAEPNESSTDPIVRFIQKEPNLDLIEHHLPVSAGLLRFGSDAILFGGHMFDMAVESLYQESLYQQSLYKESLYQRSLYQQPLYQQSLYQESLYQDPLFQDPLYHVLTQSLKGTSRATYRLALGEDCKTLYSSECKIMELNKPKFWPAVVEVGREIHVFDSDPFKLAMLDSCWNFSHEILRPDGWSEVDTTNLDLQNSIDGYLVLDNQIYATAGPKCLLFNSVKNKWDEINHQRMFDFGECNAGVVNCVWDILLLRGGSAWNVGEVGSGDYRLHVVLLFYCYDDDTSVLIYLVRPRDGKVVGIQFIHDFFPAEASMRPCSIVSATVIKAVEDCDGKTMCVVINGLVYEDPPDHEYEDPFVVKSPQDSFLFVYTLRLEEISGAVSKAKLSKRRGEFVRAEVKNRYIFKGGDLGRQKFGYEWSDMEGIKACFIDSPL